MRWSHSVCSLSVFLLLLLLLHIEASSPTYAFLSWPSSTTAAAAAAARASQHHSEELLPQAPTTRVEVPPSPLPSTPSPPPSPPASPPPSPPPSPSPSASASQSVTAKPIIDHLAHAVPGPDTTVRDEDGDGFHTVTLNGELSHTHYFKPGPPAVVGRLVSYEWTDEELGAVIGTGLTVTYNFPVGITIVRLTVVDNSGDSSSDTLKVTVLPSGNTGMYMYLYELANSGVAKNTVPRMPRPKFGKTIEQIKFPKLSDFPPEPFLSRGPFGVRVVGTFLAVLDGEYTFFVAHGGMATQLKVAGQSVLLKSNTSTTEVFSVAEKITLKKGRHALDLAYYTPDPAKAQLVLGLSLGGAAQPVPNSFLSHDTAIILPTLHSITPDQSTLGGGGHMKLRGAGFTDGSTVKIGPYKVEHVYVKSDGEIDIKVPPAAAPGDVLVRVTSSRGESNPLHFSYTPKASMPIKFKEKFLTYPNGTTYPSNQFACIAIGPDLRYYLGSLDTHMYVLTVWHTNLIVTNTCKSTSTGPGRSITGVSFDPGYNGIRPYVASNVFYWRNWNLMSDEDGWHNGKIDTFIPGKDPSNPDICMVKEKTVVSGLPVSNHDHGVNSMVWDNDGNLYVQIGGGTNAGVSKPDDLVGGVPESILSAATVVIHLREPGFDGHIKYSRYDDPALAEKLTPDKFVKNFAYGFRNSYGSVFHSNGNIYATDNGPNKGYGPRSTSCTTEAEDPWHPDSLVLVHKEGYFGYPNRARGLAGDSRQCIYYAPTEQSRNGFTAALATFEASTNGVIEYTANCFEGQMRGDLLVSKYAVAGKGKLYRVSLDATGQQLDGEKTELARFSGLSIAMNPYGGLIMPRVQQPNIAVLQPDEEEYEGDGPRVIAVMPNRGRRAGGNVASITGENFIAGSTVLFGTKPCNILQKSIEHDWILCMVPPGSGSVTVMVTTPQGMSTTITEDYTYLNY